MAVGLSASQKTYLGMIQQVRACWPHLSYLDPSWVLTIIHNESDNDPLVVNATGRQDGLMQVIPSTAQDMAKAYNIPATPQTDPMTSILSGMAYLDYSARDIIKKGKPSPLHLYDLVQAYNEGFAAVEAGKRDPAYLDKFIAQLPIIQAEMQASNRMAAVKAKTTPQPLSFFSVKVTPNV